MAIPENGYQHAQSRSPPAGTATPQQRSDEGSSGMHDVPARTRSSLRRSSPALASAMLIPNDHCNALLRHGISMSEDTCVRLTHSSSQSDSVGSLVFVDTVEPSIVSRCSVLSCISEAGGDADLPESVSVSNFRLWIACSGLQYSECRHLLFSTICRVLKVRFGGFATLHFPRTCMRKRELSA